jgi:hypothetical protein
MLLVGLHEMVLHSIHFHFWHGYHHLVTVYFLLLERSQLVRRSEMATNHPCNKGT